MNLPVAMIEDIRALLKAQEARLLSLEEYRAIAEQPMEERVPVWLEWRWAGQSQWTTPEPAYQGYGDAWRCWTGKPSDEQRKMEAWE